MMLPDSFQKDPLARLAPEKRHSPQWVFVGPMGPGLSPSLSSFPIVAVDGGAHFCQNIDLWVGDADSYSGEVVARVQIKHPTRKDQSDLALALGLFVQEKVKLYHLWGFLGGRRDHELFNLGECLFFLKNQISSRIKLYGEDERVFYELLSSGEWKLEHQGLFSLGSLDRGEISLSGNCLYPIASNSSLTPLSSFGLSNEASGEFILKNTQPVFLYYPEGK